MRLFHDNHWFGLPPVLCHCYPRHLLQLPPQHYHCHDLRLRFGLFAGVGSLAATGGGSLLTSYQVFSSHGWRFSSHCRLFSSHWLPHFLRFVMIQLFVFITHLFRTASFRLLLSFQLFSYCWHPPVLATW